MRALTAFAFGLLFGLGLLLSGMTDPDRVKAFLDIDGDWNPALALVMGGAIAVALPAFALAKRRKNCLLGEAIDLPTKRKIDAKLLFGAAIFGLGWGLAGICPGPGLVLAGRLAPGALVFAAALYCGARLAERLGTVPVYSGSGRVLPFAMADRGRSRTTEHGYQRAKAWAATGGTEHGGGPGRRGGGAAPLPRGDA
jgi:uncharacterized membrane protein YedE/YeeE